MIRGRFLVFATGILALGEPALAQSMQGMNMQGMVMSPAKAPSPKPAAKKKSAAPTRKAPTRPAPKAPAHPMTMDHDGMADMPMSGAGMPASPDAPPAHDMSAMPGMDMAGTAAPPVMAGMAMTGTALPAGKAPAPAAPTDHYADRFYAPADMARARTVMMREDGGLLQHQLLFNIAEIGFQKGHDGYRWDAEGFVGGDVNRLWVKSEGTGRFQDGVDSAEFQALYSRAIGPYYNLQVGVRQDVRPSPSRTYATIGFEGLAPYQFETAGAVFVSTRGDVLGRIEGLYDQRITQRLILQPRAELNFAAQAVPEDRYGAGLVDAELGLRLRYEIRRDFAPYIGVAWDRKARKSADYARADGEAASSTSFVTGIRAWF